jgi:hypothetical protein
MAIIVEPDATKSDVAILLWMPIWRKSGFEDPRARGEKLPMIFDLSSLPQIPARNTLLDDIENVFDSQVNITI